MIQQIFAYGVLILALGYLVWKFLLPKSFLGRWRKNSKSCGQDDCGCH